MIDHDQLLEMQSRIVLAVANTVDEDWFRILISFEIEEDEGERCHDSLAVFYSRKGDKLHEQSINLTEECFISFIQLNEAMASGDGEDPWGSFILEIDRSGSFRFSFSYEPPRRLNGDFSDEAMFAGYDPLKEIQK